MDEDFHGLGALCDFEGLMVDDLLVDTDVADDSCLFIELGDVLDFAAAV
jgi:hypothetical protein